MLALISGGLSPKERNKRDETAKKLGNDTVMRLPGDSKQAQMSKTEDVHVIDARTSDRRYAESCFDSSFLLGSSEDRLDSEEACNQASMEDENLQLRQQLHNEQSINTQNAEESAEPDPDLCEYDEESTTTLVKKPEVVSEEQQTSGEMPEKYDDHQQQEVIITGDEASEGSLIQDTDAKLARAMARELARLEASLSWPEDVKERSPWIDINNMEAQKQQQEALPMAQSVPLFV